MARSAITADLLAEQYGSTMGGRLPLRSALMFVAVAVLSVALCAAAFATGSSLLAALAVCSPLPMALAVHRLADTGDPFDPAVLYCAVVLILFVLGPLAAQANGFFHIPGQPPTSLTDPIQRYAARGVMIAGLGSIGFAIGYLSIPARREVLRRSRQGRVRSREQLRLYTVVAACALLSLVGMVMSLRASGGLAQHLEAIQSPRVGLEGQGVFILLSGLARTAFFLYLGYYLVARPSHGSRLVLSTLFAYSLAHSLAFGARMFFVSFLLAVAIAVHYSVRRFSLSAVIVTGLCLLLALESYGVFVRWDATKLLAANQGRLVAVGSYLIAGDFGQHVYFLGRHVTGYVDEYGALNGSTTLVAPITQLVPRALLPDKPMTAGSLVTSRMLPATWRAGTGLQPTVFGEMYLNFGLPGVFAGLALIGAIMRWLAEWVRRDAECSYKVVVIAVLWARWPVLLKGDFSGVIAMGAMELVPLLVGIFLVGGWNSFSAPASPRRE